MKKTTAKADEGRMISESESALDQLIREGARKMLQSALDHEVAEFIERMKSRRTEEGLREIVRNGHFPERDILSGTGPLRISVQQIPSHGFFSAFRRVLVPLNEYDLLHPAVPRRTQSQPFPALASIY